MQISYHIVDSDWLNRPTSALFVECFCPPYRTSIQRLFQETLQFLYISNFETELWCTIQIDYLDYLKSIGQHRDCSERGVKSKSSKNYCKYFGGWLNMILLLSTFSQIHIYIFATKPCWTNKVRGTVVRSVSELIFDISSINFCETVTAVKTLFRNSLQLHLQNKCWFHFNCLTISLTWLDLELKPKLSKKKHYLTFDWLRISVKTSGTKIIFYQDSMIA